MQSRRQSVNEAVANTVVGFSLSWATTLACFVLINDKVVAATATTALCTIWSVARSYTLRRMFNRRTNQ